MDGSNSPRSRIPTNNSASRLSIEDTKNDDDFLFVRSSSANLSRSSSKLGASGGLGIRQTSIHSSGSASQSGLPGLGVLERASSGYSQSTNGKDTRALLGGHLLFKDLEADFINLLSNAMQARLYKEKQFIVRKGEIAKAMFFIERGEVEVISEDGETVINIMKEGSFFGEIGVLFSVPRTASCRTRTRCIIRILTKEALSNLLKDFPISAKAIALVAEERFSNYVKQQDQNVEVEFSEELQVGITKNDLQNIPLFRNLEIGFLHMLAMKLKPVKYQQDERIFTQGDLAAEMYFVCRGQADAYDELDPTKSYAKFGPGTFFGEVGLLYSQRRTASVRTTMETLVFKLTKADLDAVLTEYPEINDRIQAEARKRSDIIEERTRAQQLNTKQEAAIDVDAMRERLKQIPLFSAGSISFLHQLALSLKVKVFEAGELIITAGDVGNSMFILADGIADVVGGPNNEKVYAELQNQSFFGEVALFFQVRRTATVRARVRCTTLELSKEVLQTTLSEHQSVREAVRRSAQANYALYLERQKPLDTADYSLEVVTGRMQKIPVFSDCSLSVLRSLAGVMSLETWAAGSTPIRKGDLGRAMYCIVKGGAQVVGEDGTVYAELGPGSILGEVALLKNVPRTENIQAVEDTDVLLLSAAALERVMAEFPQAHRSIALEADKRFQIAQARIKNRQINSAPVELGEKGVNIPGKTGVKYYNAERVPHSAQRPDTPQATTSSSIKSSIVEKPSTTIDIPVHGRSQTEKSTRSTASQKKSKFKRMLSSMFCRKSKVDVFEVVPGKEEPPAKERTKEPSVVPLNKSAVKSTALSSPSVVVDSAVKIVKPILPTTGLVRFTTLPEVLLSDDKILCRLGLYLAPTEKGRLLRVSKGCAKIASNKYFWVTADMRKLFRVADVGLLSSLFSTNGGTLRYLDIGGCWMIGDVGLQLIALKCPGLVHLRLSNCWSITDEGLRLLTRNLTFLNSLDISYCAQVTGTVFVEHKWSRLRSLDISCCKQISDENLERLLSRTSRLLVLKMRRCTRLTEYGVFVVARHCRDLIHLDLSDSDYVSDKCLKWISSSLNQLKYLKLSFCKSVTNAGLMDMSNNPSPYEYLSFAFCCQLTDSGVMALNNIRNVRSLSFRGCHKVSDAAVPYIIQNAPGVRHVDLTACPLITSYAAKKLRSGLPKVVVKHDVTRDARGIKEPAVRATEVPLTAVFTSLPKFPPSAPSSPSSSRRGKKRNVSMH
ncbi:hypothetical protein SmJEL517_g03772 [Synchytrium microbalum]|uniref:Cyclic nucleotide-binding domain-containing protein n=1 Tax=Synchytrium microbalum TaxID=1806994 RepID=A0A507BV76_9FUNG|nr:uncharacterized protein SmJEL517_g03772 [Synchytrium microbalum]TPX33320.1 hypothetical protein SmJEL517_g03772 [Synchytrium microbalum]